MIRLTGRAAAAAALLILIAARPFSREAPAPQNPQQPVFRGGANFVNVDAYPRRDGRLVEGLTAADFQVLEDGKPQRVENFEFIRIEPNVPDAARRDPNTQRDAERLLNDPRRRAFVVYLDEYHISRWGARELIGPLREFLERVIGPSDLFAVMLPDTPLPSLAFGQRLDVVGRALDQFRQRMMFEGSDASVRPPRTPHEQWLYGCYIHRTDKFEANEAFIARLIDLLHTDVVFTSLEQLSARLAALRNERTNVLLFSSGWPVGTPAESTSWAWGGEGALPQIGVTRGGRITTGPTQPLTQDRTKCDAEMLRLIQMDFPRRFRRLVDDARRSNVSFTAIDPDGLATPPEHQIALPRDPSAEKANLRDVVAGRLDALRTLAESTDGAAIVNTNDIRTPLRRFAADVGAYYLLGYYSTNTNHDGRFRRIEVKVTKPGVRVAARSGYMALTAALAKAADSPPPPRIGTTAVEDALGALGRLRPDAELFTYGVARPDHLAVVVELPGTQAAQARWVKGADVHVTIAGETEVGGRGRIEPPGRSTLIRVPIGGSPTGPWRLNVRLGAGAGRVEDLLEISAPSDGPVGQPILFRGRPPATSPVLPAADLKFSRADRLHIEWPLTAPLDRRDARVLGRNGQPLALTVPITERLQDGATMLVADFSLAPLSAGDYLLELATTRGSRTDRSLVAFQVGR
jgi:VWFA-related protein